MKLPGTLSKIMDNYLCLRGVASIKAIKSVVEDIGLEFSLIKKRIWN